MNKSSPTSPNHSSLMIPQIILRTKLTEEKYSEEVLSPPGAWLGPGEEFPESDIELGEDQKLYIYYPRKGEYIEIKTGGATKLRGTILRAIEYTPSTALPNDRKYGKILVDGQEPPMNEPDDPEIEPEIDIDKLPDCCCLDLGKDPDGENHQQLHKGQRVEIKGPQKRKNSDYDPDDDESEEPEFIEYYIAEPIRLYVSKPDTEVQHGENGTITRKDTDGNDVVMAVSGERIQENEKLVSTSAYDIELVDGTLYFMRGACPRSIE